MSWCTYLCRPSTSFLWALLIASLCQCNPSLCQCNPTSKKQQVLSEVNKNSRYDFMQKMAKSLDNKNATPWVCSVAAWILKTVTSIRRGGSTTIMCSLKNTVTSKKGTTLKMGLCLKKKTIQSGNSSYDNLFTGRVLFFCSGCWICTTFRSVCLQLSLSNYSLISYWVTQLEQNASAQYITLQDCPIVSK